MLRRPPLYHALHFHVGHHNARSGFRLLFSAAPFPGHQGKFARLRPEHGGTWYRDATTGDEGWLCPALFKYFDHAPETLYAKAEGLTE